MQPGTQGSAQPPTPPQGSEIIVERPPPGLGRGEYAWPAWAIVALGASGVVLGLLYILWRLKKRYRP